MLKEIRSSALMLSGFGLAAICLSLLLSANLSPTAKVVVTLAENLGVGVGSIGFGSRVLQARKKGQGK